MKRKLTPLHSLTYLILLIQPHTGHVCHEQRPISLRQFEVVRRPKRTPAQLRERELRDGPGAPGDDEAAAPEPDGRAIQNRKIFSECVELRVNSSSRGAVQWGKVGMRQSTRDSAVVCGFNGTSDVRNYDSGG